MIVGVCGFGYSGSGALIDYLKEIDGISVLDNIEMNLIYIPDGIKDLEYHLCDNHYRFMSSDVAIYRFLKRMETISERTDRKKGAQLMKLAHQFIDAIVDVTWEGYSFCHRDEYDRRQRYWKFKFPAQVRFYLKKLHIILPKPKNPTRKMYLSISPASFESEARNFINGVVALFGGDISNPDKMIVIDQLFAADNIDTCVKFVPGCKVFNVVRDPRDIYLLIKVGLKEKISFIPTDDVQSFVRYYRALMDSTNCKSSTGIVVRYEDLIYHYEETTKRICKYLNVEWRTSKTYFDPAVSIRNTQLINRFPAYVDDIKYIEKTCSEFLYQFDSVPKVDIKAVLF